MILSIFSQSFMFFLRFSSQFLGMERWRPPRPNDGTLLAARTGGWGASPISSVADGDFSVLGGGVCTNHQTYTYTGWWFGTFFIFPYIGDNHPKWLIFFRGVETTNQYIMNINLYHICYCMIYNRWSEHVIFHSWWIWYIDHISYINLHHNCPVFFLMIHKVKLELKIWAVWHPLESAGFMGSPQISCCL